MKRSLLITTLTVFLIASAGLVQGAVLTVGTGPGGVGLSDGSSTLEMWYNADALGLADNTAVQNWTDSSGNGKTASDNSVVANQPVFKTGVAGFNGRPVVRFDGTNDQLRIGSYTFTGLESYFFVHAPTEGGTGGRGLLADINFMGAGPRGLLIDVHSGTEADKYWINSTYTFARQWGVNGAALNTLGTDGPVLYTGAGSPRVAPAQIAYAQTNPVSGTASNLVLGGGAPSAVVYFGDMAEGIVFSNTVNTAQRSIIENYLSSKYDINLAAGNHYDGDLGGKGDYDQGVFGIGRIGSDQHLTAGSAGFGFEATSLTSGQWILAGHNSLTTASALRWNRAWYLDVTALTGSETLSLAFDWSDAGVGSFNSAFTRLLYSSSNGGPFVSIATGTYVGDHLSFNGLSSSLFADGYYTIGVVPVPEPSSMLLACFGGLPAMLFRRHRHLA